MTKISGKNAIVLINGYNFSTFASNFDVDASVNPIPVQGFTDGCENSIPGLPSASIKADLFWDSTVNSVHAALSSNPTGNVTIIPEGYVLGNPTQSLQMMQGNYSPKGTPTTAIEVGTLEFMSYGQNNGIEYGYALAHGTITNTTSGTAYQVNASPVTAKCSGTLHIWTPCAADTYIVKIQHCTTSGGVYADLVTFTLNGSARASERVSVASGTINQYIKVLATRTGSAGNDFGFSVHFWQSV